MLVIEADRGEAAYYCGLRPAAPLCLQEGQYVRSSTGVGVGALGGQPATVEGRVVDVAANGERCAILRLAMKDECIPPVPILGRVDLGCDLLRGRPVKLLSRYAESVREGHALLEAGLS